MKDRFIQVRFHVVNQIPLCLDAIEAIAITALPLTRDCYTHKESHSCTQEKHLKPQTQ